MSSLKINQILNVENIKCMQQKLTLVKVLQLDSPSLPCVSDEIGHFDVKQFSLAIRS